MVNEETIQKGEQPLIVYQKEAAQRAVAQLRRSKPEDSHARLWFTLELPAFWVRWQR